MKWSDFIVPKTNYATHNLSKTVRATYSPGLLYPVWNRIMLPGDRFRVNLRALFRTNPVKAPLMGSFKYRFVTVAANFKNYAIGLEGYQRSFDWRSFMLPTLGWGPPALTEGDPISRRTQLFSVRETSLADYLGYQRGWSPNRQFYNEKSVADLVDLRKSAFPFLVYYDFYRNYLVNPQEDYYPIVSSRKFVNQQPSEMPPASEWSGVAMKKLSDLDKWFRTVHASYSLDTKPTDTAPRDVLSMAGSPLYWPATVNYVTDASGYADLIQPTDMSVYHGGLVSTLFDPDLNTNWMSVSNYSRLSDVKVNTQGSSGAQYVSYQDIIKTSHLWDFVFREVTGGGTYSDLIYSQYGVSVKADQNIPQIIHVFDGMIGFEDITATANGISMTSTGEPDMSSVVGEQFGVGRGYGQSPSFTVSNPDNNFCLLMTFLWITPQVDYATGVPADSNITKFSDLFFPAFDNYTLQPRFREQLDVTPFTQSAAPTNPIPPDVFSNDSLLRVPPSDYGISWNNVLGYQPAFSEYKSDIDTVHGLFKNQLSYWANIRRIPYLVGSGLTKSYFSSYVYYTTPGTQTQTLADASQYSTVFSVENEDNFQAQIHFEIKATRPISKSVMPHVK